MYSCDKFFVLLSRDLSSLPRRNKTFHEVLRFHMITTSFSLDLKSHWLSFCAIILEEQENIDQSGKCLYNPGYNQAIQAKTAFSLAQAMFTLVFWYVYRKIKASEPEQEEKV